MQRHLGQKVDKLLTSPINCVKVVETKLLGGYEGTKLNISPPPDQAGERLELMFEGDALVEDVFTPRTPTRTTPKPRMAQNNTMILTMIIKRIVHEIINIISVVYA